MRRYSQKLLALICKFISMRIRKGDTVKIMAGKDRGKTGKILAVYPSRDRILVEGVNLYKKHVRPKRQGEKGQVVTLPRSLHASNAMFVCPHCGKPTRVGSRVDEQAKSRVRCCKRCKGAF